MESKEQLTNEMIRKRFPNQFDLVNLAIQVAGELVRGRAPKVRPHTENIALIAIEEIKAGKDMIQNEEPKRDKFDKKIVEEGEEVKRLKRELQLKQSSEQDIHVSQ